MYELFLHLALPNPTVCSVLAIGTTFIGHRAAVPVNVMSVLCELLEVDKQFVANPAGDIDVLIGVDS